MSRYIETIRIEGGRIYNLPYHNRRMNETRRNIFQASDKLDLSDYIHPEAYQDRTKCRVVYEQEIVEVEYAPYAIRPVSSLHIVEDNTFCYQYKSTDRDALNRLFASRGVADDVFIVQDGLLTDTSICNIALWNGERWLTPSCPLLQGTKRASLMDEGVLFPSEIKVDDLKLYSRIRLFNAMIEFGEIEFPVGNID
ncbi:MAG: hypothetical protein PARBA_03981 [Parabacteroides sp.]